DGIRVTQVRERERLESGGAIRNAVGVAGVKGRFVVVNGDIFIEFDLGEALAEHERRGADLTLALCQVEDPSQFGVAALDGDGLVTGFVEKPPRGSEPGNMVNAGVWVFEAGLVDEIPPGAVRVEETLFPSLVGRRRVVLGYCFDGVWADIGTPERYLELNLRLLDAGRGTAGTEAVTNSCLAAGCQVEDGATVRRSVLGAGCVVGRDATIEGSVLWEKVAVHEGAFVGDSVLADGVVVGAGARAEGVVAGRGAVILPGVEVPRGTSLEPGERYHGEDGS
ncbi:MAG: NDP-sugar synthase, partial [Dehalococcoidia bacterium]